MNVTEINFNCDFCGCSDFSEIGFYCNDKCHGKLKNELTSKTTELTNFIEGYEQTKQESGNGGRKEGKTRSKISRFYDLEEGD